jgi:hypothetical protein
LLNLCAGVWFYLYLFSMHKTKCAERPSVK